MIVQTRQGSRDRATWREALRILLVTSAVAFVTAGAFASPEHNQVGAVLVFPTVITEDRPGDGSDVQTTITVTNTNVSAYVARVSFIGATGCDACQFTAPLAAEATLSFFVESAGEGGSVIRDPSGTLLASCPEDRGFIVVNFEAPEGVVVVNNEFFGQAVVTDLLDGTAYSINALHLEGGASGNGDLELRFDGNEYDRVARLVASEFLVPDYADRAPSFPDVNLTLVALNFIAGSPPSSSCDVTTYDRDGDPTSETIGFGCWTQVTLDSLSAFQDTHGFALISCEVTNPGGTFLGGVVGALTQVSPGGTTLGAGSFMPSETAFGRLLQQSITTGDDAVLDLR